MTNMRKTPINHDTPEKQNKTKTNRKVTCPSLLKEPVEIFGIGVEMYYFSQALQVILIQLSWRTTLVDFALNHKTK